MNHVLLKFLLLIYKSIVAGEIYRVPNTDETFFINKYEEITKIILEENK